MNLLSVILLIFSFSISPVSHPNSQNPLANTKWQGFVGGIETIPAILAFKQDSLLLIIEESVEETMSFKVKGDTLEILKLEGSSPCYDELGIYTFSTANDELVLKPSTDLCAARSKAFAESYKKMK